MALWDISGKAWVVYLIVFWAEAGAESRNAAAFHWLQAADADEGRKKSLDRGYGDKAAPWAIGVARHREMRAVARPRRCARDPKDANIVTARRGAGGHAGEDESASAGLRALPRQDYAS